MRRNSMGHPPDMIMLLGSTGSGKSASRNTIIGVRETFDDDFSPEAVTRICQSAETELGGQTITVIDTVGLSDTSVKITDAQTQIERMITLHGVDVFLLVIKLGETFTVENSKVVQWILDNSGVTFSKHSIVLFTHGDQLHEPIEDYLRECETLQSVVDQCSGRYHVFNNKNEDRSQVTELLEKTESLRMMNAYKRYTEQDYKQTQNRKALLLKKCAAGAAGGAAVGGLAGAVVGAMGGYAGGGAAAGGGVAMASMMGTAVTVGQAALLGAAGGAALAAVAVGSGVYFLARKYISKEKDKSN
ncbi:hypothetical protein R3I93_005645 [Phoxinus phoxinus]|uniref:AIG1-type G domain-containing protein n=1 Tax=Phoxinus phoxinus TaxID=58324 RepID=A0AAN9D9B6_9TELE